MNSANIRNIYLKRAPLFYQVTVQYLRKQWIDFTIHLILLTAKMSFSWHNCFNPHSSHGKHP